MLRNNYTLIVSSYRRLLLKIGEFVPNVLLGVYPQRIELPNRPTYSFRFDIRSRHAKMTVFRLNSA